MAPGKRWQGVGSINRVHENGTTCSVKWDSGRSDIFLRSLLDCNPRAEECKLHMQVAARASDDCGMLRLDRSLLINDLIVKKTAGGSTPNKAVSDAPATPATTPTPSLSGAQTPSSQDNSYTPASATVPKSSDAPTKAPSPEKAPVETSKITGKVTLKKCRCLV